MILKIVIEMKKEKKEEKTQMIDPDKDNKYISDMLSAGVKLPDYDPNDVMAKGNFSKVMELIESLESKGFEVRADCQPDMEPNIYSKDGKRIAHIGIRAGSWYAIERSGRPHGRYKRISTDAEMKEELEAIIQLAEKVNSTKSKQKRKIVITKSIIQHQLRH